MTEISPDHSVFLYSSPTDIFEYLGGDCEKEKSKIWERLCIWLMRVYNGSIQRKSLAVRIMRKYVRRV